MKKRIDLRTICMVGVLAAVCFAGNYARIKLPMTIGGTSAFTLGNITCVLSGLLLGPIGGLASGIGAAMYDIIDPAYIVEAPITFLNKGAMGLVAGLIAYAGLHHKDGTVEAPSYRRYLVAAIFGALTYYVLYFTKCYFYNGLAIQGLEPAAALLILPAKVPTSLFNGVLAVVVAPPLAVAIRKAMERSGIRSFA
jgi:uncharacterized membrane protein